MNNAESIFKTKIVNNTLDKFWTENTKLLNGKRATKVLVVTTEFSKNGNEEALLHKMMGACNLNTDEYYLVQIETGSLESWHKMHTVLKPKVVFLFGVHPQQLGISALFKLNEPNRFYNCILIPASPLTEIEKNINLKSYLWNNAMSPVFIDNKYNKII